MTEADGPPPVDKSAWDNPGKFAVASADGRTERIEGWLTARTGDRPKEDADLQKDHRKEHGYADDKSKDATHLIGYGIGGPSAETDHDTARANLIEGDRRINRSHITAVEDRARAELENGPVYCQADVIHGQPDAEGVRQPEWVRHRLYRAGDDGQPQLLHDVQTRVDRSTEATLGEALKGTDAKRNVDYINQDATGTHRSEHGPH